MVLFASLMTASVFEMALKQLPYNLLRTKMPFWTPLICCEISLTVNYSKCFVTSLQTEFKYLYF